jgi:hypothetical protein
MSLNGIDIILLFYESTICTLSVAYNILDKLPSNLNAKWATKLFILKFSLKNGHNAFL